MKLSRADALRLAGGVGWIVGGAFVVASATSSPPAHAFTDAIFAFTFGFLLVAVGEWLGGRPRRAAGNGVAACIWLGVLAVDAGAPLWPSVGAIVVLVAVGLYFMWSELRGRRNGSTG